MTVDIEKLEALAKGCRDEVIRSHGWAGMIADADLLRRDSEFLKECSPEAVVELIGDLKRNQRMLLAAVCQLGEINTALGADMDSDCDELIGMIADLKSEISGLKTGYEAYERVNAELRAENERLRNDAMPLELVAGDQLPPVGSTVLIHLGRSDAWVEHTVVGYYAWCDLTGNEYLHRVFVRVRDADGYLNARLLKDVRAQSAMSKEQSHD